MVGDELVFLEYPTVDLDGEEVGERCARRFHFAHSLRRVYAVHAIVLHEVNL